MNILSNSQFLKIINSPFFSRISIFYHRFERIGSITKLFSSPAASFHFISIPSHHCKEKTLKLSTEHKNACKECSSIYISASSYSTDTGASVRKVYIFCQSKISMQRVKKQMKVLVVYDTVSPMKLTAKVAETISGVLRDKGIQVDSFYVADVDTTIVKNYDCLIAGAPTMYFRASSGIINFLKRLPSKEFSGKLAAAFDTQVQSRFSGSAVKGIEGKLKGLGFRLITAPLIAYVDGKTNEMHLKEGELEKAEDWAQTIAETLSK